MPINKQSLRKWNAVHIDETIEVLDGVHENELFYNCTIKKVLKPTLIRCCFSETKFTDPNIQNWYGTSCTLDCNTFSDIELPEEVFDFVLMLLLKTKGNRAKRQAIIEIVGRRKVAELITTKFPGD